MENSKIFKVGLEFARHLARSYRAAWSRAGGVPLRNAGSSCCAGTGRTTKSRRNSKKARSSTQPGYLHPSLLEATRLPHGLADYGDATKLFWKIVDLFRDHIGLSREHGVFMTRCVFSTWFPDLCASPITLCVTGLNMSQIMRLFRLLHVLCRRPLMVAALNTSLPFYLHPTLLVNVPSVSTRIGSFWRATNYRGAVIPGPRGTMRSLACAKIIFCETEAARIAWGPEALHIALLPTTQDFPSLSELEEAQLAAEYLPQLLMFRLRTLSSLYQPDASSPPSFPGFPRGGSLPACIAEDPEILEASRPMLEAHEQDLLASRARDPHVAIVESVWAPSHKTKEMSTAEITKRVNALLHERGETLSLQLEGNRLETQELGTLKPP